jgi:hypothetical protein
MNNAPDNSIQENRERLLVIYSKWLKEMQTQLREFKMERGQIQRKLNKSK